MTATVFPAGLYRTAVRPNLFAVRARFDPAWMIGTAPTGRAPPSCTRW